MSKQTQQEALQMQTERATRQKYEISHLKRLAIRNDFQKHSVFTIAAIR